MNSASTSLHTFAPEISAPELPRWVVTTANLAQAAWRFWAGEPGLVASPAVDQTPAPIRFRHPHTGQGWDGHGPQPQWLRDAVLTHGYTIEELRRAARTL